MRNEHYNAVIIVDCLMFNKNCIKLENLTLVISV